MITKMIRYKPYNLLAYEALLRNLRMEYRENETILHDYYKIRAGFIGEKNLDYKLNLLSNTFTLLPDIRLKNVFMNFQMDVILLTPKVIFILEGKHLRGILEYYGNTRQLVQKADQRIEIYKDPILQVQMQRKHLIHWLHGNGFEIPIESFVVFTNEKCLLQNLHQSQEFDETFVTLEHILFKIEETYKKYTENVLDQGELNELIQLFIGENNPLRINLMEKYGVQKKHLSHGMSCYDCLVSLSRVHGKWKCFKCEKTFRSIYKQKVLDYFLLVNDFMTNETCRDWLKLQEKQLFVANRLLRAMDLSHDGVTKARKYYAPPIWEFPQNAEPYVQKRVLK